MKPAAFGLLIALAAVVGLAVRADAPHIAASAQTTGAETLSISPGNGPADTWFTVIGEGFAPGTRVTEVFFDPTGAQWEYPGPNIVVDDNGRFEIQYNLGVESVSGAPPPGRWTAQYCYEGTDQCWVIDFIIDE